MKIVSYNARCVWKGDGVNGFMHRAGMIWDKVRKEKPDVIAFQEVVSPLKECLETILPEYLLLGHFRNADYGGEGVFTAIRRDTWDLHGLETFWMSPTPYVPGSRYPGQSTCPRICAVTLIRNRFTGELLRIYNFHLDHISDAARVDGMQCVLDRMEEFDRKGEFESVLLGDFNAEPDSGALKLCDTYERRTLVDVTAEIPATFHGYGKCAVKIDYLIATKALADRKTSACVWDDTDNGIFLSDHYPVCVEFADKE